MIPRFSASKLRIRTQAWLGIVLLPFSWLFAGEAPVELSPYKVIGVTLEASPLASSSTLLGEEDWDSFNPIFITDILGQLPALQLQRFNGSPLQTNIQTRGYSSAGGRILVLVDGVPLNRPDLGGLNWSLLPLGRLARIEFVRGSQSVLYGSSAIGGVLRVDTVRTETEAGSVLVSAGSDGEMTGRLHFRGGKKDLFYGVEIEGQRSDGYRENSGFENLQFNADLRYHLSSGRFIDLRAHWGQVESDLPGGLFGASFPENPRRSLFPNQSSDEENRGIHLHFQSEEEPGLIWEGFLALMERDREWSLSGLEAQNLVQDIALQGHHQRPMAAGQLRLGIDSHQAKLEFSQADANRPDFNFGRANLQTDTLGLYAHWESNPERRWKILGGVRWDYQKFQGTEENRSPFGDTASPWRDGFRANKEEDGFAAQIGLDSEIMGWIRLDRFFRYPLMDEYAAYQGYTLSRSFNPQLEAERGYGVEWGKQFSGDPFSLELVAFYHRMEREIAFNPVLNLNENLAATERGGVEFGLWGQHAALAWELSASWTLARYREGPWKGKDLPLVPPFQVGSSVHWDFLPKWSMTLTADWLAAQFEGNDNFNTQRKLPSRAVSNFHLRWSWSENAALRFSILNWTDTAYATIKYQGEWYPEPGRQWRGGIEWTF